MVSGRARAGDNELAAGSSLDSGEVVTTGDEGYATLVLADGSTLTLQPHTRLRLDSLQHIHGTNASLNNISLDRGRVEAETVPQQSPAAQHRLRMPAVVLSVRGTRYRAAVTGSDGRSLAEVTQGKVAIGKNDVRGQTPASRVRGCGGARQAAAGTDCPAAGTQPGRHRRVATALDAALSLRPLGRCHGLSHSSRGGPKFPRGIGRAGGRDAGGEVAGSGRRRLLAACARHRPARPGRAGWPQAVSDTGATRTAVSVPAQERRQGRQR